MPKFEPHEYRSVDEYRNAVQAFHGYCGLVLFGFARYPCATKDLIIRNFLARTDTMVRAVLQLWDIADYQDCWILNRCLLDRLFHLFDIGERDEFQVFDDWSFLRQYHAQNRLRGDPEFRGAVQSQLFTLSAEQKERAHRLSENPPRWQRPKPEAIAERMDLRFLYKYGYDYGSRHVHPMANDGQQDFFTITGLKPAPNFPDQRSVLSNSLLVGSMIVQEGLNRSKFRWRSIVYDFLDHLRQHLADGRLDYQASFLKISSIAAEVELCEPSGL